MGKVIDFSIPEFIIKENNITMVSNAIFEKNTSQTSDYDSIMKTQTTNCYIIRRNHRYSNFQIKKTQQNETYITDNGFSENSNTNVEVIFNGKSIAVKKDTDITDINSIRYQLRNNKGIARFIDTFILTDEKARKKYAIYENKQQYLENKKQKSAFHIKQHSKTY